MTRNPRADHGWKDKILRRERFTDFAYTLARIEWQFFITHTYSNPIPKRSVCVAWFWQFCREISEVCEVPYNRLLIALRCEYGEANGRFHLHSLVGGIPSCNMWSLRSRMIGSWKRLSGNAHLEVRLYDRSLAGADYICKCLGANAYELSKFTLADETTLSHSVLSAIGDMDASGDRRCRELMRKDGRVRNGSADLATAGPAGTSTIQDITASALAPGLDHPTLRMRATLGV